MKTFANLDFEYAWMAQLEGRPFVRKAALQALCDRWSEVLWLLSKEGDVGFLPWGWTLESAALASSLGVSHPPLAAVEAVNSKCFSHQLEDALGCALPGSSQVDSRAALEAAIAACPHDWVVKHPWGVSGRERIVGRAHAPEARLMRWAERKFARGWTLLFEPWLQVERECSMHFEIAPDGRVRRLGACALETDNTGTHRGNKWAPDFVLVQEAWVAGEAAAQAVAARGYFGPVGIDAMWARLDGTPLLRPIVEINARVTFGRLTLALTDFAPAGCTIIWRHPTEREAHEMGDIAALSPLSPTAQVPGRYRLPEKADPGGKSGTYVLLTGPE